MDDDELIARIRGYDRPRVLNPDWVVRVAREVGLDLPQACVIAERTPCGPTTMATLFTRLREHQDRHGLHAGFRRYGGGYGPEAERYADHLMARLAVWRERLAESDGT